MVNPSMALLDPDSEEFEKRMEEAYERYANSEPSATFNERIRPADQDFFDWVMADKESLKATNKIFESAGIAW